MNGPNRRQFLLLACLMGGAKAFAGESEKGGDNGIGGTGYRPGDNGIGGTGFIGVIRKFGSVYVNGQRIAYPNDAAIEIDGSRVAPGAMRLGQVARLVADRRGETWTTQRIVIVSEVVGPVGQVGGKTVEVLGQSVRLPNARIARALKTGDRIAVSGLRRPDQTIVASAVERREGGLDQIAGVLARDAAGGLRIAGQKVAGVGEALVGQRVVMRGGLDNSVFVARDVKRDADIAIGGVKNVSIETWVSSRGGTVETAGGVPVEDRGGVRPGSHHVVIDGEIGADGRLIARQVEFMGPHGGFDPPGGGGPRGSGGSGGPGGGFPGGGPNRGFGGGPGGGLGGAHPGGVGGSYHGLGRDGGNLGGGAGRGGFPDINLGGAGVGTPSGGGAPPAGFGGVGGVGGFGGPGGGLGGPPGLGVPPGLGGPPGLGVPPGLGGPPGFGGSGGPLGRGPFR